MTLRTKICAIVAVLSVMIMQGCGEQTGAKQIAALIEDAANAVDETTTTDEAINAIRRQQAEVLPQINNIVEQKSDEKLTDSDKDCLREAMTEFVKVNIKKSATHQGEDSEEAAKIILQQTVYPVIDQATTLSDLNQAF